VEQGDWKDERRTGHNPRFEGEHFRIKPDPVTKLIEDGEDQDESDYDPLG